MKKLFLIAAPLALAIPPVHAADPAADSAAMFARLDINGDGKIDKAEVTKMVEAQAAKKGDTTPIDGAQIDELIKRVDSNGDGVIDKAEMDAMHKARAAGGAGAETKQ